MAISSIAVGRKVFLKQVKRRTTKPSRRIPPALERERAESSVRQMPERLVGPRWRNWTTPDGVVVDRTVEKFCPGCKQVKPNASFAWAVRAKNKLQPRCRSCKSERDRLDYQDPEFREMKRAASREWGRKYPERAAAKRRKWIFGLDAEQYERLLQQQDGVCGSCGQPSVKRLGVDHDHESHVVRGLLCNNCNLGIGMLGDNIEGLERALAYLRRHYVD